MLREHLPVIVLKTGSLGFGHAGTSWPAMVATEDPAAAAGAGDGPLARPVTKTPSLTGAIADGVIPHGDGGLEPGGDRGLEPGGGSASEKAGRWERNPDGTPKQMFFFDEDSPTPLYLQLYAHVRGRIQRGELAGRLYPETVMAARYGVSRRTVRQALALLAEEGLVRAWQGRGHFTVPPGERRP
jgi:DNA-binding transcriptional ArsR family regulator